MQLKTDTALPTRAKLRRLRLEPSMRKSRTATLLPKRVALKALSALPRRPRLRKLREEPRCRKSRT